MKWEKSADNDQTRHPYDLWYQDTELLSSGLRCEKDESLWYPYLVLFELDKDADPKKVLSGVLSKLFRKEISNHTSTLPHDWAYCWYLAVVEKLGKTELIIFANSTFDTSEIEKLKSVVDGLNDVVILKKGAPVVQAKDATKIRLETLQTFAENFSTSCSVAIQKEHASEPAPVVGVVIDHALGFLNDSFCKPGSARRESRFRDVWIQEDRLGNNTMPIGRTIERADINDALEKIQTDPFTLEAAKYNDLKSTPMAMSGTSGREAGVLRSVSHGTQIAQIAFGSTPQESEWDFDLIGIQLPVASVALTDGFMHDLYVKSALNWAFFKAFKIKGRAAQLFINHSFATYAGRHDGFDILDADFQLRLACEQAQMISLAGGNGFQSATHAAISKEQISDPDYDSQLTLVVQPGSKQTTFVQFWVDAIPNPDPSFPVGFEIETPSGQILAEPSLRTGGTRSLIIPAANSTTGEDELVARLYCQLNQPKVPAKSAAPSRHFMTLAILPTETQDGLQTKTSAGDWRIKFSDSTNMQDGSNLAIWVERSDTPDGFPANGRQAYLTHPNYERFNAQGGKPDGEREFDTDTCPIRRFGTLSASANATLPTVVTAYRENDSKMSDFSAASSDLLSMENGMPAQPTLAAVSECSPARPNVLTTGTFSGSISFGRGTSISAPNAMRAAIKNVLCGRKNLTPKDGLIADVIGGWNGSDTKSEKFRAGYGLLPNAFKATLDRRRS